MNMNDINLSYIQILDGFEKAEQNIASLLIRNHELFKLLKFNDFNPLAKSISGEEIEDMMTECDKKFQANPNCRVFFEPFTDSVLTAETAMVRIYPAQINIKDIYEGNLYIQVDVIVHQSISRIKGGRRRNRILAEILKSLNGQEIQMVQELRLVDKGKPIVLRQFKSDYWGYSLLLQTGVSAIG